MADKNDARFKLYNNFLIQRLENKAKYEASKKTVISRCGRQGINIKVVRTKHKA